MSFMGKTSDVIITISYHVRIAILPPNITVEKSVTCTNNTLHILDIRQDPFIGR